MSDFRADLHCHRGCSDGTLTPAEIIAKAHSIGLSGLCITDHDSTDAYPAAFEVAKQVGLEMIPGAEFSSVHGPVSVHILAYSFDLSNPGLHQFCLEHHNRRSHRNRDILLRLKEHGMIVTEEEIAAIPGAPAHMRTIGRPHIAQIMIQKGYVDSVVEAFNRYLGEDQCCYAPGPSFTAEETIAKIHAAKGLAVIAHPHLIPQGSTLPQLLELPFDGIECYYARLGPSQNERWLKIAARRGLLMTGGSDFHGEIKPNIPLGCSWVNEETFRYLQSHFQKSSQA